MIRRLSFIQITRILLALSAPIALQACSLGMFGSGIDQGVKSTQSYRKLNPDCAKVDLSKPELDAKSFRELLHCLNANQGLDALDRLVNRLNTEQLQSLVTLVNRNVLKNPARLYQLEQTHLMLEEAGILDANFLQLGRLLENPEFVTSALAILKDGYFQTKDQRTPDHLVLKALQRLSTRLTNPGTARAIDALLSLASSKAFIELIPKFASGPGHSSTLTATNLREISYALLSYLQENHDGHPELGRELLTAIAKGDLFGIQQQLLGTSPAALRSNIPRITSVLKVLAANEARLLDGLSSLVHYARNEIPCLGGGASVKDPIELIIRELLAHRSDPATFLIKDNVLNLTWMNSFCAYPPQLQTHYPVMIRLAETSAVGPLVDLLAAFNSIERDSKKPMLQLLLGILGDTGPAPQSNGAGFKRLLPIISELSAREIWDSALLVATLLKPGLQKDAAELAKFLLEPSPELDGKSLQDVFSNISQRIAPENFYKLLLSAQTFANRKDPLLAPALRTLREGFHANGVHPLIETIQAVLQNARTNEAAFNTLFQLSELPEFAESIALVSEMARDGRLKELFSTVFTLFHKFSAQGAAPIAKTEAPDFIPDLWHDYDSRDLIDFDEPAPSPQIGAGCAMLDFNLPLSGYQNPAFADQLGNLLSCVNSDGHHDAVVKGIEFLNQTRTESGQSYFAYLVDLISGVKLSGAENSVLIQGFIRAFDDGPKDSGGRIFRFLHSLPFWFGEKGDHAAEPLLKLAKPVVEQTRPELTRLQQFAARQFLANPEFTRLLAYGRKLFKVDPDPAPPIMSGNQDLLELLVEEIRKNECEGPGDQASIERRAQDVIDEFNHAANNWELVNGKPRDSWEYEILKERLDPILQKVADPAQSAPDHTLRDALLNFLGYFSLVPGDKPSQTAHFSRDALFRFFKDRSSDYRPISYIYEGESKPRVRLVNSIDRLELVLINADMVVPAFHKNYGLQFTAEIGEAWGDEPYEAWPREIQQKFPKGSRKKPKTLRQAVDRINRTFRFFLFLTRDPKLPDCRQATWKSKNSPHHHWGEGSLEWFKRPPEGWEFLKSFVDLKTTRRNLFNVNQVIDVLYENLPEKHSDGVRILRNLFFELYYSTPAESRSAKALTENNLRVAIDLVKLGLGRQPGRLLAPLVSAPESTVQLATDFFSGLISAAQAERTPAVLDLLLGQPDRFLLWEAIRESFKMIGNSTPEQLERLKDLAFYLTVSGHQLGAFEGAIRSAEAVLSRHLDFLGTQMDKLEPLARSQEVHGVLRKLVNDSDLESKTILARLIQSTMSQTEVAVDFVTVLRAIESDAGAKAGWGEFIRRKDQLLASPEYQSLRLSELTGPMLDFFEEKDSGTAAQTARKLRFHLADQLERGNLDPLLVLAAQNPVEFYRVLKIPSATVQKGELQEFLLMIRRALGN